MCMYVCIHIRVCTEQCSGPTQATDGAISITGGVAGTAPVEEEYEGAGRPLHGGTTLQFGSS